MKKFNLFSLLAVNLAFLFMVACGDDSSSATQQASAENSSSSEKISEKEGAVTEVPCEEEGAFSFPEGNTYSVCENGFWKEHVKEVHKTGFDPCQFNFGAAWQAAHEQAEYYRGLDYVAVWLGDNDFYNGFERRMVARCVELNVTPMIYGYVIAEFGKDVGLEDCDVAKGKETSLCVGGANLIREFFVDSILYRYREYAAGMREQIEYTMNMDPADFESIWLIEPDFYQYSESGSKQKEKFDGIAQLDGGIPDSMMGVYFKQIVDTIKAYLPAAKIAIDISPWALDQEAWYSNFDMDIVDFASTSGGRTYSSTEKIRPTNPATWSDIARITGKPVLADAGYDAGGEGTGHAKMWDQPANINARIENGVVGVMQMDAALDYPARLDTIRPQITAKIPGCEE